MHKQKTIEVQESAVLVGVINRDQSEQEVKDYLDELSFLVETAGGVEVKRMTQRMESSHPKTFIGKGKLQELDDYIKENNINLVVFDDDLSPSQFSNVEKVLGCKVLDRTNLILDIFATRAQTAYAKTQVELAQYTYLLPRLRGMWTHLERQRGGIGMRGPGEREIETDRRIIRDKISKLKLDLTKIDRQMATQRKNRGKFIRASLVGYTNVGKSTLLNLLSKSDVFAENKLFATLDTTVRKVVIENLPFLLSDTVGFIRKLPHHLIESFKSTLDEVRESDILLHVVDISHPNFEEQIEEVNKTLKDLNVEDIPLYMVFNKIDAFSYIQKEEDDLSEMTRENFSLEDLKKTWMAKNNDGCFFISAKTKLNINEFKDVLYERIKQLHIIRYPYDNFLF